MSRSGYYDQDCGDQWQSIMWSGNVRRCLAGRKGQAFLREMLAALDALPDKKLIAHDLVKDGAVCAIGSVGLARGVDMTDIDPEDYEAIAKVFGIKSMLVREIEFVNDDDSSYRRAGMTDEQRWLSVREWVVGQLK